MRLENRLNVLLDRVRSQGERIRKLEEEVKELKNDTTKGKTSEG